MITTTETLMNGNLQVLGTMAAIKIIEKLCFMFKFFCSHGCCVC